MMSIEYHRMYGDEKDYPVFKTLPEDARSRIRAKAQWEHMSLSAIIREYPDLWTTPSDTPISDIPASP